MNKTQIRKSIKSVILIIGILIIAGCTNHNQEDINLVENPTTEYPRLERLESNGYLYILEGNSETEKLLEKIIKINIIGSSTSCEYILQHENIESLSPVSFIIKTNCTLEPQQEYTVELILKDGETFSRTLVAR